MKKKRKALITTKVSTVGPFKGTVGEGGVTWYILDNGSDMITCFVTICFTAHFR